MRKGKSILIISLLVIAISGCSPSGPDKLRMHRQNWQKQDIINYRFDLSIDCFCPAGLTPATIIIRDDTVKAVLDPKTGKALTLPDSNQPVLEKFPDYYPTVEELFKVIQHGIEQGAVRLDVKYDSEYGYPKQINLEYSKNISDDAVIYEVSHFGMETPAG